MKTHHAKDSFNSYLLTSTATYIQLFSSLQPEAFYTYAYTNFRKQSRYFTCKVFLILLLMISELGGLNGQPAGSACGCLSYVYEGTTGEKTPISEISPISNCTYFRGIIVIDEPTNWNDLSIRMETGSSIEVRSSFNVDECNIGTCDDLWKGIYVVGSGTSWIVFNKSIISGAEIAIELTDQSSYFIQKSQFVNNYIGISTGSPFAEVPSDIIVYPGDGIILGCHFYTDTQVPDPYPGQYYYPSWPSNPAIPFNQGYAAMYIAGSTGLYVGELGATSGERNKIYNMRNGVIVRNATTKILGTDFKNFEGSVPKFVSYDNVLDYNQRAVTLDGSICHMEQDSILNVMIGVHSNRSSQVIANNYIEIPIQSPIAATRGIDIKQPVQTKIVDNSIYNGFMGISVFGNGQGLQIEDNNLFRWLATENNVGINLQKIYGIALSNIVRDNELEITGGKKAVGISMNNVGELRLFHNTVDFLQTMSLTAGTENAGISGMQVYISLIAENFITGTANYKSGSKNAGIVLTNCMANDLNCNETDDMYYGQWYIGANMDTYLKSNEFYDATHGLDLFSPVSLGIQVHNGNKWLGAYVNYGAYISGLDADNTALASQFIADDSDISPGGVLIPALIGPVSVEDDWFVDVNGITGGTVCNDYPPIAPVTDSLVNLVRYSFEYTDYEDEMNWMRKADILTFLHLYPSYLSNTVLDSFFDAEVASSMGELIWSQYQMDILHGIDPGMSAKDSQAFAYLSQIRVLDSLIEFNPVNIATLKALRVLKIDTLSSHTSDWLGMLDSMVSDTEDSIVAALDVVDLVTPSNNQETDLQAVLWLQGGRSLGDSLTTSEVGEVYALARQCPWLGARSLSASQILYNQVADSIFTHRPGTCFELESFILEDRSDKSGLRSDIRIFPNPASDIIFMQLPAWVEDVVVQSLDGREIVQLNTGHGGNYDINIRDLPSGIYTIRMQGGKKVEVHQISIVR